MSWLTPDAWARSKVHQTAPTLSAPAAPAQKYRRASLFEQTKAACELVADGSGVSTLAFGSTEYVAGAMIGSAIGNAMRHARAPTRCA